MAELSPDKRRADALEFAAKHFEQYGLSHLQLGEWWTGIALAEALRAFIPSHVEPILSGDGGGGGGSAGHPALTSGSPPSTTPQSVPPGVAFDKWWEEQTKDCFVMPSQHIKGFAFRAWAVASAASATERNTVIEECAKVCDQVYDETQKIAGAVVKPAARKKELRHQAIGATCCAARLRALMNRADGTAEEK